MLLHAPGGYAASGVFLLTALKSSVSFAPMITLKSATGFTDDELKTLSEAVDRVNAIWMDDAGFSADVWEAATVLPGGFACTSDSVSTIVGKLRAPLSIDFFIFDPTWWQRHFSKEIAYEDSQGVHFMRSKFDAESFAAVCNTVAHEACHAAGYTHPFNECPDRDNSVPYQIGDLVETLVNG